MVKGKTFYTTDKKLAQEARKKVKKAKQWFASIDGLCDDTEFKKTNRVKEPLHIQLPK